MFTKLLITTKDRIFRDTRERPGAYKLLANTPPLQPKGRKPSPAPPAPAPASAPAEKPAPVAAQTTLFEQPPATVEASVGEARKEATPPVGAVKPLPPVTSSNPFAAAAQPAEKNEPAFKALARQAWKRAALFCKRLVQRFVFGRKGRPIRKTSIQTELALDKVTVLKNDLNEDDLEVVLVERKVGRGEKPLARVSKIEMTGEAWMRLTAPFRKKNGDSASNPKAGMKMSPELNARA